MKLYLLLLNILFASTSFAFESYHKYNNKYIVTTDCNTMYVCNSLGDMTIAIPCPPRDSDGWMLPCEITVTTFYNCVEQNGNTFHSIKSFYSPYIFYEDSKNPFTECKNSPNYHTANIKISDCRTSYKKGDSNLSYQTFANNVESRSFNYFTADGVHDRVLTGYGWCKYNNLSGRCGAANGLNCRSGQCCSKYNYCGTTSDYCKKGCQGHFGHCN